MKKILVGILSTAVLLSTSTYIFAAETSEFNTEKIKTDDTAIVSSELPSISNLFTSSDELTISSNPAYEQNIDLLRYVSITKTNTKFWHYSLINYSIGRNHDRYVAYWNKTDGGSNKNGTSVLFVIPSADYFYEDFDAEGIHFYDDSFSFEFNPKYDGLH